MGSSITQSFGERVPGGDGKSVSTGVNHVSSAVFQNVPDIDDWVSSLRALVHEFVESFLNSCDVFRRDRGTNNFADKLALGLSGFVTHWFDVTNDSGILTCTS